MKLGLGHHWVKFLGGKIECDRCGARPNWPVAEEHCPVYRSSPTRMKYGAAVMALSWEELEAEVKRAFDAYGENPLYRCVSPSSPCGRDGRRRTGI